MTKLKLVGAARYICEAAFHDVIVKGQIIEVADDKVADALLADVRVDELNNEHAMFVEMTDEELEADVKRAAAKAKVDAAKAAQFALEDATDAPSRAVQAPARRRSNK